MDIPPSTAPEQQMPPSAEPEVAEAPVAATTSSTLEPAESTAPADTAMAPSAVLDVELAQESGQTVQADGVNASGDVNASQSEAPAAASFVPEKEAAAKEKTVHYSMDSLFGPYFELKVLEDNIEDLAKAPFPALMDVQNLVSSQFGDFIRVQDIQRVWDQPSADVLAQLMRENKEECDSAELERLFGKAGMSCLLKERTLEPFRLLECAVPKTPSFAASYNASNVWLVDMPKIQPNRQILHADPQPYAHERGGYLESDDRMLYTPHNVIRWAYHKGQNTYMSNARLVRWSDGSVTLHVGEDMYALHDDKSNASLHVLGTETKVRKGDVEIPCVLKALNPSRHFVMEGSSAKSVTKEITNEAVLHDTLRQKRRLPYLTAPTPYVDLKKPASERTLYEECVHDEIERKRKVLEQMIKEGNPPTMEEQVALDNEMWNRINSMTRDDMLRQQQEARQREAVRVAERQAYQRSNRRERNLELEGGDMSDRDEYEASRKRMRAEEEEEDRLEPLRDALDAIVDKLPPGSEVANVVAGFIGYISSSSYSEPTIENELPDIIKSIEGSAPDVDVSPLRRAHQLLFGA